MKILPLGPPAAGKGTQAAVLSERYSIPTISTGAIIRQNIKDGTELGIKAKSIMDRGELLPDDVVIDLVMKRISEDDCKNGFIFDGFPRTVVQADAVDKVGLDFDKVISIEVADEEIVSRITGRRECPKCGKVFHTLHNPSEKGTECDNCGETLVTRADDSVETVTNRLRIYHEMTSPLKAYYKAKDHLVEVKGREEIEDTTADMLRLIGA